MWDKTEFERAAELTVDRLSAHVARSERGEEPAIARRPLAEITADLDLHRLIREGGLDVDGYAGFLDAYLARTTRLHHPGALAHQVAVPDFPAALADLIHGVTNNPMAIYDMGPAGAAIEVAVLEWMLSLVGWDAGESAGVLTHGGSLANLTALLGARARAAPSAWTDGVGGDLAVLAPRSAHYSIARAVAILGLGEAALVPLEVDALERVRVDKLEEAVARVRGLGRRPVALVAAACATATGLHDDLVAIGAFCRDQDIWLHVDGAHGASALLSPGHRGRLAGIERADSVVWDAHKMLRTSGLCAAVLFRRGDDLAGAFHQEASYLFYGGDDDPPGVDLLLRTIECTKATLGLKLFLNLAFRGERGLGEYVASQYEKTRRFHALISARPGFECPYEPESNILCFRYGRDDAAQLAIRERLRRDGDFHLSSAEVGGERYLRLSVMSPATDEAAIEALLDAIERAAG